MAKTLNIRIGAAFPATEISSDRGQVRAFVEAVGDLGFDHILALDHILGAYPPAHPEGPALQPLPGTSGWENIYDYRTTFHEPFVLFGFVAALTELELFTGVLILPQRQTALVAKQAAQVDILSGGKLRLGVGIGWNNVEYEGLGKSFTNRGRRIEEQVRLLRELWTHEVVTFEGEYESVVGAAIAPLPVQRPIPIWMGSGYRGPALERAGRIADGWLAQTRPGPDLEQALETLFDAATKAGRDPADLGIHGGLNAGRPDQERIAKHAAGWKASGATHISLGTSNVGLPDVDAHIAALARAIETVRGELGEAATP
jgi:probable F420-dependent oxidoreductase